jgi:hypothetical protein
MKKYLLIIAGFFFVNVSFSQGLYHGFGIGTTDYSGTYGSMSTINFQYTPMLYKTKGSLGYGISSPMSYSVLESSARDYKTTHFELPIAGEISFNPSAPCTAFESYSIFAGGGVSRVYSGRISSYTDYMNMYLGIRIPPFQQSFELRFNYGRELNHLNFDLPARSKMSFSLSYILK